MTTIEFGDIREAFQTAIAALDAARDAGAKLLEILKLPLNGNLGARGEAQFSPQCLNAHLNAASAFKTLAGLLRREELAILANTAKSFEDFATNTADVVNGPPGKLEANLKAVLGATPVSVQQMPAKNDVLRSGANEMLVADYAAMEALKQAAALFAAFPGGSAGPLTATNGSGARSLHLVGGSIVVLLTLVIVWFFVIVSQSGPLARVDVARGLLTLLVGGGTVLIGVVIITAMWLGDGDAESDRKFLRSKEVFGLLLTVLATVMGFYYGTEKSASASPESMELAPIVAVREAANNLRVATSISGGKAPYSYSIAELQITNAPADGRRIERVFTNYFTNAGIPASFKIVVMDANSNRVSDAGAIPKP